MNLLPILACLISALSDDTLLGPRTRTVFAAVSEAGLRGEHQRADSIARGWESAREPEGQLLRATAALASFSDIHDPADLRTARASLDRLEKQLADRTDPRSRLLLAMGKSQESYLASLEGRSLASALAGRSAASIAQGLLDGGHVVPEAQGIVGGYLFWKSQSVGSVGRFFAGDQRARGVALSQVAAEARSPFREAFRTSLLWIRFEQGDFAEALKIARSARADWPQDRPYHQAEGDVLFRMGRHQDALDVYRSSFLEYRGVEVLPVNRMAAAGNLARIHASMGRTDSARAWLDTLDAPRYREVRKWLPPSLVRELEPVRRELARK